MFSRIHTMKLQNELAKVSMKGTLKSILNKKKRTSSGVTAPSKGLTLYKVYY